MTTGILQETMQVSPQGASARFRPYASPNHHVTKGRYITSNDPRGYIPVYEYPLNGQWIMMDIDDGYILWTGIWKALGHSKADIVKMVDSQPDLAPLIRRVRGGYLKIQGTWMPYEVALRLSRRVAWTIRDELVPLFGPTFPSTCLSPDQPGYGQVVAGHNRRRARRGTQAAVYSTAVEPAKWNTAKDTSSDDSKSDSRRPLPIYSPYPSLQEKRCEFNMDIDTFPPTLPCPSGRRASRGPPPRYSPYPPPSTPSSRASHQLVPLDSLTSRNSRPIEHIVLPPIRNDRSASSKHSSPSPYALPPISALEDLRGIDVNDSAAVLRRLRSDDDSDEVSHSETDQHWDRRRPPSTPTSPISNPQSENPYRRSSYGDRMQSDRRVHPRYPTITIPSPGASQSSTSSNASPISPATPHSIPSSLPSVAPSVSAPMDMYRGLHNSGWPFRHSAVAQEHSAVKTKEHRSIMAEFSDEVSPPLRPW
ncbi:hypothetical protein IW261DRAFT_822303 [Armillaria novae-zelandiae]|uniref:HTH APSES-type domain-containing protein n=1 Tax=Armillaria novae-zelandiae TaxID=153914 RepID=A0AA39NUB4_9AGAR|nr:hypothetical protein IW261DRAFT_822303 [Armillaria novae-zelandiae]